MAEVKDSVVGAEKAGEGNRDTLVGTALALFWENLVWIFRGLLAIGVIGVLAYCADSLLRKAGISLESVSFEHVQLMLYDMYGASDTIRTASVGLLAAVLSGAHLALLLSMTVTLLRVKWVQGLGKPGVFYAAERFHKAVLGVGVFLAYLTFVVRALAHPLTYAYTAFDISAASILMLLLFGGLTIMLMLRCPPANWPQRAVTVVALAPLPAFILLALWTNFMEGFGAWLAASTLITLLSVMVEIDYNRVREQVVNKWSLP